MDSVIEELAKELKGKAIIGIVDVRQQVQLFRKFGVRRIPHFYLFRDGTIQEQLTGGRSKSDLRKLMLKYGPRRGRESG
jgi:thioredoxin 1